MYKVTSTVKDEVLETLHSTWTSAVLQVDVYLDGRDDWDRCTGFDDHFFSKEKGNMIITLTKKDTDVEILIEMEETPG